MTRMRQVNQEKNLNKSMWYVIISLLICVCLFKTTPTQAASKVTINSQYNRVLGYQSSSKYMKPIAKKLGLKQRSHSNYRTYFASGKNLWMGINKSASYPKNYVCIKNTGNKSLTVLGVTVGMSKATAYKQLRKYYSYYSKSGNTFGNGVSSMYLNIKNGKVVGYTYKMFPTS